MADNKMQGGCLCGALRFTADNVHTDYEACHCGMCRRWTGSLVFATSVAALEFENRDALGVYDSSEWAARGFCRNCGSSLFYYLKPADRYVVSIGAFDDADKFRLSGEIFIDHKPPGYDLAGNLPKQTEEEFLAKYAASDP